MEIPTPEDAILMLENAGCGKSVINHCKSVSKNALMIAKKIKANGHDVDLNFVETAALLHDIGRSKTHGISHGIEGAKILKDFPPLARVCECHIGAGIKRDEAVSLGLPEKDYLPETLEEKIIAHADNITEGNGIVPIERTIKRMETRLEKNSPALMRMKELNDYIEGLMEK